MSSLFPSVPPLEDTPRPPFFTRICFIFPYLLKLPSPVENESDFDFPGLLSSVNDFSLTILLPFPGSFLKSVNPRGKAGPEVTWHCIKLMPTVQRPFPAYFGSPRIVKYRIQLTGTCRQFPRPPPQQTCPSPRCCFVCAAVSALDSTFSSGGPKCGLPSSPCDVTRLMRYLTSSAFLNYSVSPLETPLMSSLPVLLLPPPGGLLV